MSRKFNLKNFINMTFGVILIVAGYYFFFAPANLVTGGITGVSLILSKLFEINQTGKSIFIFIANCLLLIIGGLFLGKKFFLKTLYGTILLPVLIFILSIFKISEDLILKEITTNKLLISSVGGSILTGIGLGLTFKSNATTGGMDVIQKILSKKIKIPYSLALYTTDGIIVLLGFFVFKIENTFYAVFAIIVCGIVIDRVILSGKSGYTVFIISNDYELLRKKIYERINRGITKISVVGGYSNQDKNMLICTITKNQLYNLKSIIEEVDSSAFTFITKTTESLGQGFK